MRMMPSDPRYPVVAELWGMYAIARNPQVWFGDHDVSEAETLEIVEALEYWMQVVIDGLPVEFVRDFSERDEPSRYDSG